MENELLFYGGRVSGVRIHTGCEPFTKEEMARLPNNLAAQYEDATCTVRSWKDYSPRGRRQLASAKSRRTRLMKRLRALLTETNRCVPCPI